MYICALFWNAKYTLFTVYKTVQYNLLKEILITSFEYKNFLLIFLYEGSASKDCECALYVKQFNNEWLINVY